MLKKEPRGPMMGSRECLTKKKDQIYEKAERKKILRSGEIRKRTARLMPPPNA